VTPTRIDPDRDPDALTPAAFVQVIGRHVGHTLRCARESTGQVGGWLVETVALRCDDCGEVLLEGIVRTYARRRRGSHARA
jgi:hypothetical protein